MTQLPINSNDAATGHMLQGMSKDVVIISSWPAGGLFKNWEYFVLSRVRTQNGLYLFEEIDMTRSFKPSPELALFFDRAREKNRHFRREKKTTKTNLFRMKKTQFVTFHPIFGYGVMIYWDEILRLRILFIQSFGMV